MNTPKRILFVGDLHTGGHHSVLPRKRLPEFPEFPGIRYLNDCWDNAVFNLPEMVDITFFMGDLVEGTNRKAEGTGLFSTKLSDQVESAIELLAPIAARSKTVFRVKGTDYHDSVHNPLLALDIELGVRKARQVFDVDLGSGILNVAHHPSGGGALYLGTKLDKEQRLAGLAALAKKVPHARWIFRAHLHNFAHFITPMREVILTPCWKLPDAYSVKGNYFGWQPDIGMVLMEEDERSLSGFRVVPILYDLPQPRVITQEELDGTMIDYVDVFDKPLEGFVELPEESEEGGTGDED